MLVLSGWHVCIQHRRAFQLRQLRNGEIRPERGIRELWDLCERPGHISTRKQGLRLVPCWRDLYEYEQPGRKPWHVV